MAEKDSASVLERKLAAAGEADRGTGRSVLRALRLALARTAKELYDLQLAVIGAKQVRCEQEGAGAFLADDRLLVLLDGADGMAGAVSMDGACVGALIQQQTMGRVTGTAMSERAFTGTDAAMAEPLIEAVLSRASELADAPEDQRCLSGYRFGARVEDVRSLLLALEADRYRVFDLTIDVAEGAMQGSICLLLPDLPMDPAKSAGRGAQNEPAGPNLDQAFGVMRAELTASICRLRIPLTQLASMQPGDVLPLVRERLEETELVTINGQSVAAGRLGQINGLRAVRLNETTMPPDFGDQPGENGFAPRMVVQELVSDDSLTLDGSVVTMKEETRAKAGLPALIDEGGAHVPLDEGDADADNLLDRMTPEEAAAEISQLAGLSAEDAEG